MGAQIQKSNWRRGLVAALLIGVALSLTACAKDGSKKSTVGSTGYIPGCPNCTNVPGANVVTAAIAAREDVNQYLELGMRLHATSAGLPAWQYYGPVTTSGYLVVEAATWGGCAVLPPGIYKIRSLAANGSFAPDTSFQPFNLMNHSFDVVHTNGFVARVAVNYAEFYDDQIYVGADGTQFPHRMYGEIQITPVTSVPTCYMGPVRLMFPRPF